MTLLNTLLSLTAGLSIIMIGMLVFLLLISKRMMFDFAEKTLNQHFLNVNKSQHQIDELIEVVKKQSETKNDNVIRPSVWSCDDDDNIMTFHTTEPVIYPQKSEPSVDKKQDNKTKPETSKGTTPVDPLNIVNTPAKPHEKTPEKKEVLRDTKGRPIINTDEVLSSVNNRNKR